MRISARGLGAAVEAEASVEREAEEEGAVEGRRDKRLNLLNRLEAPLSALRGGAVDAVGLGDVERLAAAAAFAAARSSGSKMASPGNSIPPRFANLATRASVPARGATRQLALCQICVFRGHDAPASCTVVDSTVWYERLSSGMTFLLKPDPPDVLVVPVNALSPLVPLLVELMDGERLLRRSRCSSLVASSSLPLSAAAPSAASAPAAAALGDCATLAPATASKLIPPVLTGVVGPEALLGGAEEAEGPAAGFGPRAAEGERSWIWTLSGWLDDEGGGRTRMKRSGGGGWAPAAVKPDDIEEVG